MEDQPKQSTAWLRILWRLCKKLGLILLKYLVELTSQTKTFNAFLESSTHLTPTQHQGIFADYPVNLWRHLSTSKQRNKSNKKSHLMSKKLYNKLVRDNVPEIMRAEGEVPETRVLDDDEYKKLVRLKLLEEAGETRVATGDELTKELGDV